jgi:glycosyltransferase 2 family protein
MAENNENLLKSIKPGKIFIPIGIGLAAVGYMFYDEFEPGAFSGISFSYHTALWLFAAFTLMLSRDIGYVIRLKILSGSQISWIQAIRIILLWEFTSAITPSAIGGTSIAVLYVHKEGLSIGKSTAVVMATSFLDELYFLLMFPILILIVGYSDLFYLGESRSGSLWANEFFYFAAIGYTLKLLFTSLIAYGLFFKPTAIRKLLLYVFSLGALKRWRGSGEQIGTDIVTASAELKSKPFSFWVKSLFATFISWSSRYWVVNCLFLAFFAVDGHILIFARQLVMWIMMLVSPTPGGSGFAEYVFSEYLGGFIPIIGLAMPLALLWRIVSYYVYLVIGAFVFPHWIKLKFSKKKP